MSCEAIAQIKGIPVQTVYEETTKNALKLFPKLQRFIRKWHQDNKVDILMDWIILYS